MATAWDYKFVNGREKSEDQIETEIESFLNTVKPSDLTGVQSAIYDGNLMHIFARKDNADGVAYEILIERWGKDSPSILQHFMGERGCALIGFNNDSKNIFMRFALNKDDVPEYHRMKGS